VKIRNVSKGKLNLKIIGTNCTGCTNLIVLFKKKKILTIISVNFLVFHWFLKFFQKGRSEFFSLGVGDQKANTT